MLTVDYLLGDNKNRYFGRGYKRTTYEVNTLRKSLQTTSASPCRTQVQPAASFLVCSLIFIECKFSRKIDTEENFLV